MTVVRKKKVATHASSHSFATDLKHVSGPSHTYAISEVGISIHCSTWSSAVVGKGSLLLFCAFDVRTQASLLYPLC